MNGKPASTASPARPAWGGRCESLWPSVDRRPTVHNGSGCRGHTTAGPTDPQTVLRPWFCMREVLGLRAPVARSQVERALPADARHLSPWLALRGWAGFGQEQLP